MFVAYPLYLVQKQHKEKESSSFIVPRHKHDLLEEMFVNSVFFLVTPVRMPLGMVARGSEDVAMVFAVHAFAVPSYQTGPSNTRLLLVVVCIQAWAFILYRTVKKRMTGFFSSVSLLC